MSTSSLSSASSKEFEYIQNADYDAKYLYARVQPSVNSQSVTLTTGQTQDITVDLINKSVNLARSYVQMNLSITYGASMAAMSAATDTGTTAQAIVQNAKAPPLFAGIAFYPEQGGINVIPLGTRLQEVNQMLLPYSMTTDEFKNHRDNSNFCCYPNEVLTNTQNQIISGCATAPNTVSTTSASTFTTKLHDIQYTRFGGYRANAGSVAYASTSVAITETCRYKLADICPRAFLSQDIVVPPSAKSNGQLVFTMGFPDHSYFLVSGAGVLTSGAYISPCTANTTWAQYGGTVTITNFEVHLAVEANEDVDRSLKAQVMSDKGFNVNINYPVFYQAQLDARTNHTVPYSIEPANGQYIREIFTSPVISGQNVSAFNYDYNNLRDSSYYLGSSTSTLFASTTGQTTSKIASYYTSIDSIRQEPYDLTATNNNPWSYYKKSLGKTAISTAGQ